MLDIWGFLLQTLTVSGAAILILAVKALFKDKLPPKWQFAVWSALGLVILIPAGLGGRYTLFRWQLPIEIVKSWVGDYSFTRVLFPIPVIASVPQTFTEWLFAVYVFGVLFHIARYVFSYLKLKWLLRIGAMPCEEKKERIRAIASQYGMRLCRVIEVSGLPSAFVCGVLRPVLVLPAGEDIDEKIILHELFHLKNRDTLWSVIICFFRCLHWCNPLIVYCADRAINDMESRCDQYVLERLEGEERREYGRILLSMANERFSKTPGSTCINNGGRSIRERIENIARFKKYPHGMRLVSVCAAILLAFPLAIGVQAGGAYELDDSVWLSFASARSTPCTTPAGAFDTYGKAILDRNGYYRAMCAPESMQEALLTEMRANRSKGIYPIWNCGLDEWTDTQSGYCVYNLKRLGDHVYEGLFVVELSYPPNGKAQDPNMMYLAVQDLRVEMQHGRWVVIPQETFRYVETRSQTIAWGCAELPGIVYAGEANGVKVEVTYQTVHTVDSKVTGQSDNFLFGSGSYYDTTPKPNTEFTSAKRSDSVICTHTGSGSEMNSIMHIGLSFAPVAEDGRRPEDLEIPSGDNAVSSSNTGEQWISRKLYSGWGPTLVMDGGGASMDPTEEPEAPAYYAADLYLNSKKVAQLDLILREGEEK